jgi:hypothetical protein
VTTLVYEKESAKGESTVNSLVMKKDFWMVKLLGRRKERMKAFSSAQP